MESKLKSSRRRAMPLLAGLVLGLATAGSLPATADTPAAGDARVLQQEFDAALAAIEQRKLRTARAGLNRLLAANPSLSRARLELARVQYLQGDYAAAREEAQRVLGDPDTPPPVRATVLAFLAQIDADERRLTARHTFTPSLYVGALYDSNVNVGPSRDIIDIGGVPFVVAPDSRETSDWAAVIDAGISHTYNPNRRFEWGETSGAFIWQSELDAYYRGYFDETDFNLGVLTLRTGPAWIVPDRWRAYIGLQAQEIFLDGDNLALFASVNPGITWQLGSDWELGIDAFITDRNYDGDGTSGPVDCASTTADAGCRDGLYIAPYLTVGRYFANRTTLIQAGFGYPNFDADGNADADRFSYSGPDVFLGFTTNTWKNGAVFGRLNYRWYDFDGIEPGFGLQRDDEELRATIGFQHDIKAGPVAGWALVGAWTYTKNDSNVAIYEYDRHQVGLGLSRQF